MWVYSAIGMFVGFPDARTGRLVVFWPWPWKAGMRSGQIEDWRDVEEGAGSQLGRLAPG